MPFDKDTAAALGSKGGKWTKPPGEVRNKQLKVSLTPAEYEAVDVKAAALGLSKAELIARAVAAYTGEPPLNFYVVANGYMGDGYCRVYVAAESDDRARQLASEVFKAESEKRRIPYPDKYHAVDALTIAHSLNGSAEGVVDTID